MIARLSSARPLRRKRPTLLAVISWSLVSAVAGVGCRSDAILPPPALEQLIWAMEVNHRAVTLSVQPPENTIQLTVTLRNVTGAAIIPEHAPEFRSLDTLVSVDSLGRVTALHSGKNARVVVTVVERNSRFEDTLSFNVNNVATVPVVDSVVLDKPSGGILQIPAYHSVVGLSYDVVGRAYSGGRSVANVAFVYMSSDTSKVSVDRLTGELSAKDTGRVVIAVSSTVYGQQFRDSIVCEVIYPLLGLISIEQTSASPKGEGSTGFFPGRLILSRGASVLWVNRSLIESDVTFDDPSTIEASPFDPNGGRGNISPFTRDGTPQWLFGSGAYRARTFSTAGVYRYRNSSGAVGEIVVNDF